MPAPTTITSTASIRAELARTESAGELASQKDTRSERTASPKRSLPPSTRATYPVASLVNRMTARSDSGYAGTLVRSFNLEAAPALGEIDQLCMTPTP
jgi:hypothetical protein